MDHRGTLQLWNGGALACQGVEVIRPQGTLVVQKAMSSQNSAIWGALPRCTIIQSKKA